MAAMEIGVNGARHVLAVDPARTLLEVLRDELGLTGAKYGCGEGQCGACTVLLGDRAVRACSLPIGSLDGAEVTTVEGLGGENGLHPVQEAFADEVAMQCGYCTPGMVVGAVALLRRQEDPSEQDVRRGMQGHVCRCGTYPRVVRAVRRAAQAMGAGGGR